MNTTIEPTIMDRDRPRRAEPPLKAITKVWGNECFRCGRKRRLERAHVIDRCYGGLDNLANIRPLCSDCHRYMPSFAPGDEERALRWVGYPGQWHSPFLSLLAVVEQRCVGRLDEAEFEEVFGDVKDVAKGVIDGDLLVGFGATHENVAPQAPLGFYFDCAAADLADAMAAQRERDRT